ncbi:AMP-binding protein, partial [Bacteroides intestinalis]|uniref:AMP-binding protein n=2 Tax=Bacteroides TaxID=816 RepID=UPI0009E4AD33
DNTAVITDLGESLTYLELSEEVEKFVSVLTQKVLVFTLCENLLGAFVGYVACMNNNIPQVLLDGSKDLELVQRLIAIYQPEYIWMPTARVNEIGGKTIYQYQKYSLQTMTYIEPLVNKVINSELQLCLTTSGSTGSPKLVRLSERNVESNAKSIAEYLNINENERPVTSLPMYYSYGMSVINSHLIKGATILLTDKTVMQREFWNFVKEQKATSLAGVPYTYEMLKRLRFFRMDLPELKTMIQAGGKLNAAYVKEYVDFAEQSDKQFIVMYGQTEAAPRMSYLPFDKAVEKNASIGIAIPGGQFCVMDTDGNEIIEPDVDGELVYKGENVCLGYAEVREDLMKGDENFGELHTGDIAKFDADGFYYITGRMKRFVKVWGNRTNLDSTEQLVKAITPNCACAGVDDLITVFVTEEGLEEKIKALLVEKTGLNLRAFQVKVIQQIPVKTSGKIDYPELQKML